MDHLQAPIHPMTTTLASLCGIFSGITGTFAFAANNIDLTIRSVAGLAAIVSAFFAARYYNIAYQEKKQSLIKNKQNQDS
jgi:hypothetical protein